VHNSVRKYILKKMVLKKRLLPKEIISRKKQGFGVPIDYWFHRGFDDLAAQVFERTYSEGNFESILARTQVSEILKKPFANAAKIFALMVLAVWYQMYIIRDERVPPLEIEKYT
jgi:asparagine synthase (glutamine-hydrolysing)